MLQVEYLTSVAAFDALRDDWEQLLAVSPDATIFQTWEWVRNWYQHFGDRRKLVAVEAAHLRPRGHREEALRRGGTKLQHRCHLRRELIAGRGVISALRVARHAAVPEERIEGKEIEQRRRVARNEDAAA